ncbi:MAG: GNAT family N-acetyltransferase [Candidatus Dependentiae bacterium]|nr:GNAT family N-acetyltransferase [Candidatus Dependentiae bacterium]
MNKHGDQETVTFKKITEDDVPLLRTWFQEPHVEQWWPTPEAEEDFIKHFVTRSRSKDTFAYISKLNDVPFGYIQYYYFNRDDQNTGGIWAPGDLPETTVGIDQLIGDPQYLGKGYGTRMLQEFITYITQVLEPHITTIILDPKPTNTVAIKCYEKVGFKRVGVVDAPWGPALFMRYDVK